MKKEKSLIQQLKEFGLNPKYWIIKRLKKTESWILVHKKDHHLCLLGQTKEEGVGWKKLEWLV